jgi:uncharacterized metal-binding protein (TIGR02443 family)
MKIRICPQCQQDEVMLVAGGSVGMYECKECGFRSSIFPEMEIEEVKRSRKSPTSLNIRSGVLGEVKSNGA